MKYALYGFILPCLLCSTLWANNSLQDSVITGKITDENGIGLPWANVQEKGTKNGVVTDLDGGYKIKVKDQNSILVISYLGYLNKEVVVGTLSTITIKLESDSKKLEEVVVVGYGTQKRSEVTNAVVQITGDQVKKSNSLSVSNSLSGKLAGLYVNQRSSVPGFDDAQILVRGSSTYRNSSALIVIDGVANGDPDGLNRLDPKDIETISVLKDASAAVYGAQSAGGVILVTTKRGKTGTPTVDFTTVQSFNSPTMKARSANAFEYMDVLNNNRLLDATPPDFPDAFVQSFKNGERRGEDWWDALMGSPAVQSRHSLTMRGGTERIKYFTSLGTASQEGVIRGDNQTKLNQYNVRSNLDVSVTDNFDVGLDLTFREKFTQVPQNGNGGGAGYMAITSPLQEAYVDGDFRYPTEGSSQRNPAAILLGPGYLRYTADVTSGTIKFKYKMPFLKGLALDGFASVVKTTRYNKIFDYTWFYYAKNPAGVIEKFASRTIEDPGLREDYSQEVMSTQNLKLSYDTKINESHKISAFVAYEQMDYKANYFWTQRLGYDSPLVDQLFAGSVNRLNWNNSGNASESGRQNYVGRISYDFKSKYLLGLSARYDGSPIFPEDTRFGYFPQISAGWVVSKESFMPKDLFSNLKIRASWGKLGNDRVGAFQYIGAYGYSSGYVVNGVDVRGIAATNTPNPNITWEVSEKRDLGLELGFLNNKLTFEVDVYRSITSDILGARQASIPAYTGLALPDENIGKMDSQGIEFQAGYRQNFGGLNLRLNGNVSYNENEIVYFDEAPQAEPYQKLEGMPLNSGLVYKAIGIYRTQADLTSNVSYPGAKLGNLIFEDLNKDGVIDTKDRYMADITSFPKMQFGLNIGLDYKNFDLNILLQGQSGAKWRLNNTFRPQTDGNGLAYVANNTYSLVNPDAELPRIRPTGIGASDSDFYYHDVVWCRFKTLELGYNIPKDILSDLKISAIRLYLSGDNLFMLYNNLEKYGAGDPEFLLGNGSGYPNMKTMSIGLNLSF